VAFQMSRLLRSSRFIWTCLSLAWDGAKPNPRLQIFCAFGACPIRPVPNCRNGPMSLIGLIGPMGPTGPAARTEASLYSRAPPYRFFPGAEIIAISLSQLLLNPKTRDAPLYDERDPPIAKYLQDLSRRPSFAEYFV